LNDSQRITQFSSKWQPLFTKQKRYKNGTLLALYACGTWWFGVANEWQVFGNPLLREMFGHQRKKLRNARHFHNVYILLNVGIFLPDHTAAHLSASVFTFWQSR